MNNLHRSTDLVANRSFWGLTATQFLGAFNDNVYKQLALLLFVAVPVTSGSHVTQDLQWLGLLCFSLPFILFSGYAGYLSDRYSKRRIIVICKAAEIAIMLSGAVGFYWYSLHGMTHVVVIWTCVVLGLIGTHSAFFGPGKYGILPEMLCDRQLPTANGIVLMSTFLAIIFGSGLAALLMHWFQPQLWIAGQVCVAVAILGTVTSLLIRPLPPSSPELRFEVGMVTIPSDIRNLLWKKPALFQALVVSTVFWLTAAIVQPAVNALGERQLLVDKLRTGVLLTIISAGIATGSVIAGLLSRGKVNRGVQLTGAWGMVICLVVLSLPGGRHGHLLGYVGSLPALIMLGGFTGMFAVPLQVLLQAAPPEGQKGRMIATQNLLNWIGIFFSSGIYYAGNLLLQKIGWRENGMFAISAIFMIPIALFYRPNLREEE